LNIEGLLASRFTFAIGQGLKIGFPILFVGTVPIPYTFEIPGIIALIV